MTEEEMRVLAWTILGEAASEGDRGMEAVAHVIRNRSLSGRYPDNPASVALQHNSNGVYQFSTWNALTQGGNLPRAQYPTGSASFGQAWEIVNRVFGATPGRDPTQGATHYYAHGTIDEPYWWSSEAPRGGKRIGGHTFAIKYDGDEEAPTPAIRSGSMLGRYPTANELTVFKNGGVGIKLPPIGPRGDIPTPVTQSVKLQQEREDRGATVRSIDTFIFDPVSGELVRKSDMPSGGGTAKERQQNAWTNLLSGFGGTQLAVKQTYAGQDRGPTTTKKAQNGIDLQKQEQAAERLRQQTTRRQTTFAPVYFDEGSVNNNKDESRLLPNQYPKPPTGGTRPNGTLDNGADGIAEQRAEQLAERGRNRATPTVKTTAPTTVVVPPPIPGPPPTGKQVGTHNGGKGQPLKIVVEGATVVQQVEQKPVLATNGYVYENGVRVGTIRPEGMTAAEQYEILTSRSREVTATDRITGGSGYSSGDTSNSSLGTLIGQAGK